jgi:hypothetical protein
MLTVSGWMVNLQIASFQKNKLCVGFGFLVVFVLLIIAVAPMMVASISDAPKQISDNYIDVGEGDKDFPLEIDLAKTDYDVGEQIAFNATIINRSGKDVTMLSNGHQPWAIFYNINDNRTFGETTEGVYQVFKANEKITKAYEFKADETGTYILYVHYRLRVDEIWVQNEINMTLTLR